MLKLYTGLKMQQHKICLILAVSSHVGNINIFLYIDTCLSFDSGTLVDGQLKQQHHDHLRHSVSKSIPDVMLIVLIVLF